MLPDPMPEQPAKRTARRAFTGFGAVLLFVLAFVVFFRFNFTSVVVAGQSMLPTLKNGKKVLVSKAYWLVGGIQDGSIVVIQQGDKPSDYIIKRVYKMAGESVDSFNFPRDVLLSETGGEGYKVPENHVFVIGDNRGISEDSRVFGPVEMDKIIGKVVAY
jgi:signal peptidase I